MSLRGVLRVLLEEELTRAGGEVVSDEGGGLTHEGSLFGGVEGGAGDVYVLFALFTCDVLLLGRVERL